MFSDMQKMWNPQSMQDAMSKMFDMNQAVAANQQNMEAMRNLTEMWSQTFSSCAERQMQMAQEAMEETVTVMREISSAKGMEEVMAKQAEWSQRAAQSAQKNGQELASIMQNGQKQAADLIQEQFAKSAPKKAAKSAK